MQEIGRAMSGHNTKQEQPAVDSLSRLLVKHTARVCMVALQQSPHCVTELLGDADVQVLDYHLKSSTLILIKPGGTELA